MKKLLLFFLFANICIFEYAQGVVSFELKSDATFKTSDGQSYVVIPFEGKTAQELYNLVKSNVMKTYNSPKEVMSENAPTSISIRAIGVVANPTMLFIPRRLQTYYNLLFQFKDGKIRVDAPAIDVDTKLMDEDNQLNPNVLFSLRDWTNKIYEKDGSIKSKNLSKKQFTENSINSIINKLISEKQSPSTTDENW